MTEKKPKPPPGFSAFKKLLGKVAKVPKSEIDQKEAEYQQDREALRKKVRAVAASHTQAGAASLLAGLAPFG